MSKIKTPGSVIGAASVMFIYATLLMICVGCAGFGLAIKDPNEPLQAALDKELPENSAVQIANASANLLFALLLFGCGIGILFLSNIARIVTYLTCMVIPVVTLAITIYQLVFIYPIQQRVIAAEIQKQGPAPFDVNMFMNATAALAMIIAISVPVIFCGTVFILLSLKSARLAFAGESAKPPPEDERRSSYTGYDDDDDYGGSPHDRRAPPDTGIQDRA